MPTKASSPPAGLVADEPPSRYDWEQIADWLRSHPMEWYRVFEDDWFSRAGSLIQNNVHVLRREAGFEVRTSNTHYAEKKTRNGVRRTRRCSLYLRYHPENDTTRSNGGKKS